jgi:hypothetical protein
METIKEVLMRRDGISAEDADREIADAKATLQDYLANGDVCSAEDICEEFFGLEPDYLMELI